MKGNMMKCITIRGVCMLSNNEKYIFTSELALAISNGLQVEDGLKMLVGFDADVSMCAKIRRYNEARLFFYRCIKRI